MYYIDQDACTGCKICVRRCPEGAISVVAGKAGIDAEKCTDCGECIRHCPFGAIHSKSEAVEHSDSKEQQPAPPDPRFGAWPGMRPGMGFGMGGGFGRGLRGGRGMRGGGGGRGRR